MVGRLTFAHTDGNRKRGLIRRHTHCRISDGDAGTKPYTGFRDAILAHPTMAEGLGPRPSRVLRSLLVVSFGILKPGQATCRTSQSSTMV